jgi:hypothetical protein
MRKKIPHKVYFVQHHKDEKYGIDDAADLRKEIEKELPAWVIKNSQLVNVDFFSFEDCFPKILKIMSSEKKKGNEVHVALHGASMIASTATAMAAALTGTNIIWIKPADWKSIGKEKGDPRIMFPVGGTQLINVNIPVKPELPKPPYSHILTYIFDNDGKITGKLTYLSEKIGLEKISANVKKPTSGAVKLSKIISKLRTDGLVETKRTGRKSLEIFLTQQGKLIADVLKAME